MKKELIKQLEGVGFKKQAGTYRRNVGKKACVYELHRDVFCIYSQPISYGGECIFTSEENPIFEQILEAIKKHTGQDLTQTKKPTKRQQLEALTVRFAKLEDTVKGLNEVADKNTARSVGNKCEIKELKSNKTVEIIEKTFGLVGACKALAKFQQAVDSKKFPEGGNLAEVHQNERILKEDTAEEKPFEVGDPVVIVCKQNEDYDFVLNVAISKKEICTIKEILDVDSHPIRIEVSGTTFCFEPSDLEHAPAAPKEKALVFGGSAELLVDYGAPYRKGVKVLITDTTHNSPKTTGAIVEGFAEQTIENKHLKAL